MDIIGLKIKKVNGKQKLFKTIKGFKEMRKYKLKIDLPFMEKGSIYYFDDETANIYAELDGKISEYPLRIGLSAYLWLLLTCGNKYLKENK